MRKTMMSLSRGGLILFFTLAVACTLAFETASDARASALTIDEVGTLLENMGYDFETQDFKGVGKGYQVSNKLGLVLVMMPSSQSAIWFTFVLGGANDEKEVPRDILVKMLQANSILHRAAFTLNDEGHHITLVASLINDGVTPRQVRGVLEDGVEFAEKYKALWNPELWPQQEGAAEPAESASSDGSEAAAPEEAGTPEAAVAETGATSDGGAEAAPDEGAEAAPDGGAEAALDDGAEAAPDDGAEAAPDEGAAESAAAAEEKTEFDVILASIGDNKINVIKEVRAITGLGLKEAKDLVESAPNPIKEGVNKDEADKIKAQLEGAGATVELK